MFTISIANMSIFGIHHIKEINLLDSAEFKDSWVFKLTVKELFETIKMEYRINNFFDICVKISAI